VLSGVVLLVLILPSVIDRVLVERLERAAWSRGIDLRYGQLAWDLNGVVLTDVRADHTRGNLTLRRVEADLHASALLWGDVSIARIRLVEPRGHIDLAMLEGEDKGEHAGAVPNLREWPTIPPLEILRPSLTVGGRDGRPLIAAHGSLLTYDPEDEGRIEGRGTVSVRGWGERALALDGWYLAGAASVSFASAERGAQLFDGSVAGLGHLVIGGARLEADAESGRLIMALDGVAGTRGRLQFEGARVEVVGAPTGLELRVRGGGLVVTEDKPLQTEWTSNTPTMSHDSQIRSFADAVRIDVEGLSLTTQSGTLIENISAAWDTGTFEAWARIGEGTVEVWGALPSWSLVPQGLAVRGHQIKLDAVERLLAPTGLLDRRRGDTGGRIDVLAAITAGRNPLHQPAPWDGVRLDAWIGVQDGHVSAEAISDQVVSGVHLDAEFGVMVEADLDAAKFSGAVSSGPLRLDLEGNLTSRHADPTLDLVLKGAPVPCQRAFDAIPKGLLGPYEQAQLEGTFAPRVRLHWPRLRPWALEMRFRDIFRACRVKGLAARAGGRVAVRLGGEWTRQGDVDWLNRGFALQVTEGVSDGADVWIGPGARGYVPLAQLPRYVGAAAYLSEEMGFYHNRPIDRGLITRALRLNLEHDRFVYGGSTVTQQLVKNLFLSRQKTLARKLQEILIATRITTTVSRERVLELYLNCIEFGPNVYGIGRAARYYFQKDARSLTPREAVFLAMLKPAPRRGAWMRRRGFTPVMPYWQMRAEEIFARLVDKGYLSQAQAAAERPYALQWVEGRYVDSGASSSL